MAWGAVTEVTRPGLAFLGVRGGGGGRGGRQRGVVVW